MAFLISKESLEELYEHGVKSYPEEVCGFILLDESIYKAVNIQNELNKKSFETYSRTAKNGYTMSVHDTRMLDKSFKTSNPATVIYHSHPDVGAYFSQEDRQKALFIDEPLYDVDYLVLDIRDYKPYGPKLFAFIDGFYQCVMEYDEEGLPQ